MQLLLSFIEIHRNELSDYTVREDLDYADKKITKLKGEFYSAFTDGLFDNLLGEEKPTKKRSKTTRGRS